MSALFGGGGSSRILFRMGGRPFEPSEDTINRLGEMGFSRDHALDALESTESNRLEVAMKYALAYLPTESLRAARAERRRQRELALRAAAILPLPPDSPESVLDAAARMPLPDSPDSSNANKGKEATSSAAAPSTSAGIMALDSPPNEVQPSSNSGADSSADIEDSGKSKEDKKKMKEMQSVSYMLRIV